MTRTSDHYAGDAGQVYTATKQSDPTRPGYLLNFEYFQPYLKPEDCVLDFGCGNGGMLLHIRKAVRDARGLEINPASRRIAEENGLTIYPTLESLPTQPTFDAVVSNHVLEHVRDTCGTLERVRQAMKPGGRIILKLPIDSIHDRCQLEWSKNEINHHLQTWTPRSLANVLFESGFEVDECRVVNSSWHPRLFPLRRIGLDRFGYWLLAVWKDRRQLFAVARNPG